jgi:aminobenzoyl-glutamate transport protein
MRNKVLSRLAFGLVVSELLLILASWLLSSMPGSSVRSLLSGAGVRWLFGHLCDGIASPVLVWLLLLGMSIGSLRRCGVLPVVLHRPAGSYPHRVRIALLGTLVFVVIYVVLIALLTLVPHAILLSASGGLFPSPFSLGIVPVLSLGVFLMSIVYGVFSGSFSRLVYVYDAVLEGLRSLSVLFLFYVLFAQVYATFCFAFG